MSQGEAGGKPGVSSRWVAIAIALVAMATTAAPAHAASTRAEYVAQVDQTCAGARPQLAKDFKALTRTSTKVLHLGNKLIASEPSARKPLLRKLNRLAKRTSRAEARFNEAFAAMVDAIALVSPAPGDESAVSQWINGLRQYIDLGHRAIRAAKHGKLGKSLALLGQSIEALDAGGAAVQGFGISICPTSSSSPLF